MKRAFGLLCALVVVTLALVFAPAAPVEAICWERCSPFYNWTPGQWGMGATCDDAKANAIVNAYAYAASQCDVCGDGAEEILPPSGAGPDGCTFDGSQYKTDARVQYKCWTTNCP